MSPRKRLRAESSKDGIERCVVLDQDEVMQALLKTQRNSSVGDSSAAEDDSDVRSGQSSEGTTEDEKVTRRLELTSKTTANRSQQKSESGTSQSDPTDIASSFPFTRADMGTSTSRVRAVRSIGPLSAGKDDSSVLPDSPRPSFPNTFASLGLSQPLISALETINIRNPTEIQSACIGPILEAYDPDQGRDCIGGAKTGSGKTMAFALPIAERIARDPYGVWAVVLTPTRELAYQLTEQFLVVGRPLGLTTITIVGGMDMMAQAKELEQRPHIVVATPGRLCDLIRSDGFGGSKLSRVKVLVLDEADRLLTSTFAPDLEYIFSQIPPSRQTCLFTATVSEAIMGLAHKPARSGRRCPFLYRVSSDTLTVEGLKQKYLFIPSQIRDPYLYFLLQNPPPEIDAALRVPQRREKMVDTRSVKKSRQAANTGPDSQDHSGPPIPSTIIFTQRCTTAHLLHLLLKLLDIPSVPLHSHLTQPQRLQSLARFRAREIPVLVTTDVGSRGLDIPQVAMVVNWDCPRRADDYVHRVGRTARAGRGGVAVTIVTERDVELVSMIEDEIGAKMVELELPEEAVLEKLNAVSLARRMATMEMHDSGFGERQATNKAKQVKRMRRDAKK